MDNDAITKRYTLLSTETCCLSCGNALQNGNASKGEICIDLGSGRGTDVLRLAEITGPPGFVYGIDSTPEMIKKSRSAAEKLGIENVEFILASLEEIPLQDDLADLVISNCVINHASDKDRVWHEIFRLLKPGGRFVVSDIYSVSPVPLRYRSDPEKVAECWAGAATRAEYLASVKGAGFRKIRILEESAPYKKGMIEVCSITLSGEKEN
jgi:arsenite methyltransferase